MVRNPFYRTKIRLLSRSQAQIPQFLRCVVISMLSASLCSCVYAQLLLRVEASMAISLGVAVDVSVHLSLRSRLLIMPSTNVKLFRLVRLIYECGALLSWLRCKQEIGSLVSPSAC